MKIKLTFSSETPSTELNIFSCFNTTQEKKASKKSKKAIEAKSEKMLSLATRKIPVITALSRYGLVFRAAPSMLRIKSTISL